MSGLPLTLSNGARKRILLPIIGRWEHWRTNFRVEREMRIEMTRTLKDRCQHPAHEINTFLLQLLLFDIRYASELKQPTTESE